jgi:hypothetical protein
LEKERRAVTEREARREKGERNRKQRPVRREEKGEKERERSRSKVRKKSSISGSQQLLLSLHRGLRPPPSSTAIPPPSVLPTLAEPEREKRNRTEPRERKPEEE